MVLPTVYPRIKSAQKIFRSPGTMQDPSISTAIYVILLSAVAFMYSRIRAIEAQIDMLVSASVDLNTLQADFTTVREKVDDLDKKCQGVGADIESDTDGDSDEDD